MHLVCLIFSSFPLKPGSLKIFPPRKENNNLEVWPEHFCSWLNNIDQGGVGEGSPWCQICWVGLLCIKKMQNCKHFLSKIVVKKVNISHCYHWFPHKMISDRWARKFYTDGASLPQISIVLSIVWKIASTSQKHV